MSSFKTEMDTSDLCACPQRKKRDRGVGDLQGGDEALLLWKKTLLLRKKKKRKRPQTGSFRAQPYARKELSQELRSALLGEEGLRQMETLKRSRLAKSLFHW